MLEDLFITMLDMQGYSITKTEFVKSELHLWLDLDEKIFVCPHCGQLIFSTHSHWDIELKELPVLGYKTFLHIPHYRIRCECQNKPITTDIDVKEPGFMVSRRVARSVVESAKRVPLDFVKDMYGLNWNTARNIDYEYLKKQIDMVALVAPTRIGVDEVSYHKGHKYMTIVTDQDLHHIVFVTKGRKSSNLNEFFENRIDPVAKKRLEAASIDMWDPYEKSLRKHAPHAVVVYDKFHISRMLNNCVDQVRRQEQTGLEKEGRLFLKHKRFLFLKGQENLKPDQQQTLQEILEQNKSLQTAYLLKEQFRHLYTIEPLPDETPDMLFRRAFQFLVGWLQRAINSKLKPFLAFVKRIKKRWQGVLNYFLYPISNGLSEGLNNKIASLQKRAYGYRNLEYFMLKIYQQGNFI